MLLKKIFWFWWRKKKNLIQSICHITYCLILEKYFALRATNKSILSLVVLPKQNQTNNMQQFDVDISVQLQTILLI